jgi:hypothetical protein
VIAERVLDRALASARVRMGCLGLVATDEQLYYEVCRVLTPLRYPARRPGFLLPRPVSRAAFAAALARAGRPDRDRPPERVSIAIAAGVDTPDLIGYALPRVLVCQHERLAAALVANDLHMDSGTAVLGPAAAVRPPAALRAALARAPRPAVFLLHDATAAGTAWRAAAGPAWAPARVHALGLRLPQARMLHLFRTEGGGAEVAAVPPDHLLRVLRRTLTGRTRPPGPLPWRDRAGTGFMSWPQA